MELVFTEMQKVKRKKVNGLMEKELDGLTDKIFIHITIGKSCIAH
jgi:hypothetical protein